MTDRSPRALDLGPLVATLAGARATGDLDRVALGVAHDSRAVRPGSIFVALRGERADGHAFLAQAVAAGAGAVVVDEAFARTSEPPPGAAAIVVPDTRRALSQLAAAFYGFPSSGLAVVGITGTNGKTTTTYLVDALLGAAGIVAGRIGTLGAEFGGDSWTLENTTPLAPELQSLLAEMRERGAEAVVMEVSSHALALDRVADVGFALGVLTNVTRDHLDFHGTFEAYAAAKRRLFDLAAVAVLNLDDPCGRQWAAELGDAGREPRTYGLAPGAAVRARDVEIRSDGSRFSVDGQEFRLQLPGRFNVSNALAALCVGRELGVSDAHAAQALAGVGSVPGRMERIAGAGIEAIVDYAHTPDALESVLHAAREGARGRLIVVFGCGGDRDRGKRPQMGRIASELADRAFVTSDNPRTEDPQSIVDGILAGIPAGGDTVVELDRREAIRRAIGEARTGDVVLVAGKGHETYQIVGRTVGHFDDREEVRAALAARSSPS
jgi:UDP-N-acetylmuramoyl-L-alanyl-D-glutamate--2,6-diaminopimelate ligase